MAFTFQINDDVQFNHDEKLLAKAEQLTPRLIKNRIQPVSIVKLIDDASKLDGVGVETISSIDQLSSIKLGRDESVILDCGDHHVGFFNVQLEHNGSPQDSPLTLKIKFAEVPSELKQDSADYDGWLSKSWIQEELVHIDELPYKLYLPRRYAFRYIELKVVDTSPKWKVSFTDPEVVTVTSADGSKVNQGDFKDTELNQIYDASLKTLKDCMQSVFEDGPKRDRRLWLGDLRLQAKANYVTFNNADLVKRCLYLFGGMTTTDGRVAANVFTSPHNIPDDTFLFDYSLFFISTLFDYYQQTQDQEALDDLLPVAKAQMDVSIQSVDDQGAHHFDESYPVFIDWSNEFDKETAGQAVIIYTLKQLIKLLEITRVDTNVYQEKLAQMTTYATEQLFDSQLGLFISGPNKDVNIASQVWMVIAGVIDKRSAKNLMNNTIQKLFPVRGIATPYMYHHIVEALFIVDLKDDAINLMKEYWGKMIKLGADTFWEAFEPENVNYSPYGSSIISSYCHAWSCTPAYLINKYLK